MSSHWQTYLRGRLRRDVPLAPTTWFQVGGNAEYLFKPEDAEDLANFFKHKPAELPYLVLGVGSNVVIRDGGVDGVVIKLGRHFNVAEVHAESAAITVGAAMLDVNVANVAADHGIAGLEFLSGVPGTIGGAVKMNAGAYGSDTSQVVLQVKVILPDGTMQTLANEACGFSYRHSQLPEGSIVVSATLQGEEGESAAIHEHIAAIQQKRENTQPIRSQTGGSTFKNPEGYKAWELIDTAGCRGLKVGGAQVSKKHTNFMINTGDATAADIEALGEEVRRKVKDHSGVALEWEIKRIGKKA